MKKIFTYLPIVLLFVTHAAAELQINESFDYFGETPLDVNGTGLWETTKQASFVDGKFNGSRSVLLPQRGFTLQIHTAIRKIL